MKKTFVCVYVVLFCSVLTACSPEVGSVEWCEDMDKKAKSDWSMNDVKTYAENCVFRKSEQ